jgi:hypothetical protein
LVALFVFFFVVPGHDPKPNQLPIGLVGPEGPVAPLAAGLARGGDFDVKRYPGAREARLAILEREVYGALLVARRPRLLIAAATGGGPMTALRTARRRRAITPRGGTQGPA